MVIPSCRTPMLKQSQPPLRLHSLVGPDPCGQEAVRGSVVDFNMALVAQIRTFASKKGTCYVISRDLYFILEDNLPSHSSKLTLLKLVETGPRSKLCWAFPPPMPSHEALNIPPGRGSQWGIEFERLDIGHSPLISGLHRISRTGGAERWKSSLFLTKIDR